MTGLLAMECLLIGMIAPGIARGRVYGNKLVEARIA